MKLTPAKLRYLLTIAALEKTGDGIRCIDIAVQLGVSRASACRMLSAFAGEGILSQEPTGPSASPRRGAGWPRAMRTDSASCIPSSTKRWSFPPTMHGNVPWLCVPPSPRGR